MEAMLSLMITEPPVWDVVVADDGVVTLSTADNRFAFSGKAENVAAFVSSLQTAITGSHMAGALTA